uniref:Inositol polyphosphate-related phosphatase domain-containing protein n=2 Tax=Kalanchoe fedtschenkoi TaxID=63787 RepID=A0A7N0TNN0_KALFE
MKPPPHSTHPHHQQELFWPRVVVRKWLNISAKESDYSADTEDEDFTASESETDDCILLARESRFKNDMGGGVLTDFNDNFCRGRRRNSETFRTQYINAKELKVCVGTWNIGGKVPPDDLDVDDWIDIREPADIYVFGFQEVVPLNAGNIFGVEDNRPTLKWENIIRETLSRIRCSKPDIKSYSDPPSPSKFKPSEGMTALEDEMEIETESGGDEEIHPVDDTDDFDENNSVSAIPENTTMNAIGLRADNFVLHRQFSHSKILSRLSHCQTEDDFGKLESSVIQHNRALTKQFSGTESIVFSWPEPPLDLLGQHVERSKSFKSVKALKSFKSYNSLKSIRVDGCGIQPEIALLEDIDLEFLMKRKRRSPYVRIVSKQMVGIFLTIWVRRSLRRHIQNLKVSTVGVGAMGYIGNKGSVSVSMSIYQTLFCFICSHLTSGEREVDQLKRNSDVQEIHRRTQFHSITKMGLPRKILDHEKIIWLGDLNYRLNVPYEKAQELISRCDWSKLLDKDQLLQEFRRGRAFDGWKEGILTFPPTYKYELYSDKYVGEGSKGGKRTPAWCDRILSYGKGLRLVDYRRSELTLSDHRPVTATYIAEVEVFSPRRLQRALTFTEAEVEDQEVLEKMVIQVGMSHLRLGEVFDT